MHVFLLNILSFIQGFSKLVVMSDNSSPLIENLLFVFDWQMSLGTSQALSLSRRSWTGWRWVVKRIYNILRDPVIRLPMGLRPTIRVLSLLSIVISYFILNLLKLSFYLLLIVLVIAFGSLADWRSLWGVSASALFGRWEIRVVLVTLLKSNLLTVTVANSPWRWSTNGWDCLTGVTDLEFQALVLPVGV